MKFVNKTTIKLDKEINELDKLVFRFIGILKKYTDYVVISGYVAILLGRSRTTEDVDIFIKDIGKHTFKEFYQELQREGFWCLNSEDSNEIYNYLADGLAARFAVEGATIPNFEVKVAKKPLDKESFNDRIVALTNIGGIYISSVERQIAFKRYYLKSEKDIEDAKHIEQLFNKNIDIQKINKYKNMLTK
ncbi:MAG: nucleotidyltransferase [Candidatus Aenigmarchaeota archaeon]|nr:nucleotidyltransferase [Candidatus Aenigmarchaeota archaeon]